LNTITISAVLAGCLIISCTRNVTVEQTTEPISETTVQETGALVVVAVAFDDDVAGTPWRLFEIKKGADAVYVDRSQLEADGMGDVYTLHFAEGNVSGKGAPNNFRAHYKTKDASLSIGLIAQTQMAPLKEPTVLKESEFFDYLVKVNAWSRDGDTLTLVTTDRDGSETVLAFIIDNSP
jgi:hypothetical protein